MNAILRDREMWKAIVSIVTMVLMIVIGVAMVIDMTLGRVQEAILDGVLFLMLRR